MEPAPPTYTMPDGFAASTALTIAPAKDVSTSLRRFRNSGVVW